MQKNTPFFSSYSEGGEKDAHFINYMKKAGKVLSMSKSQKKSQRLVKWLADAIMTEMEKPDEEIDVEFVESCENLLNTLMGEKKLSDKEINDRVNKIMGRSARVYTIQTRRKSKTVLFALIAAVVFLFSGITICATTPLGENFLKALDLGINQSLTASGITYTYNGESISYQTIEEFLDAENLNICYPDKFAYNVELTQIFKTELKEKTVFVFDDSRIAFEIYHNKELDKAQIDKSEIMEYNDYSFYIFDSNNIMFAYFVINNDFYILSCDSKEQLIEMIYSLNFERIE